LLRAPELLEAHPHRLALLAPHRPEHHREGRLALVGLPPARDLRRQPGPLELLHVDDDGQGAAGDPDDRPDRLHHRRRPLPDRPPPRGAGAPGGGGGGADPPAAGAKAAAPAPIRPEAEPPAPPAPRQSRRQRPRCCASRSPEAAGAATGEAEEGRAAAVITVE